MDASVVLINTQGRRVAARRRSGSYAIMKVHPEAPMPAVGDLLAGSFDRVGKAKLINLSKRHFIAVELINIAESVAQKARHLIAAP